MKKSTKVLLILCLVLFLAGNGCLIAGFVMGITKNDLQNAVDKYAPFVDLEKQEIKVGDKSFSFEDMDGKQKDEKKESFHEQTGKTDWDYCWDASRIKSIELDVEGVNCKIYASDDDQIGVCFEEDSRMEVYVENGKLQLDRESSILFSESEEVLLYLPKKLILDELEVNAGGGKLIIYGDIYAKNVTLEVGGAAVTGIGILQTETLDIEVGAGAVDLQYVDGKDIYLENGAGKTTLSLAGKKADYNVSIDVAAGSVTYGDEKFSGVADTFEIQPGEANRSVFVESAVGEVVITFKEDR